MPQFIARAYAPGPNAWPAGIESAYVDWWLQVDRTGQAAEATAGLGFPRQATTPMHGVKAGDPVTDGRFLPMWDVALNPKANVVLNDALAALVARPQAILVVIDTDINPLQERFRDSSGAPRILAHWLMEAPFLGKSKRVAFGRELRRDDFDSVKTMDEDSALTELGCQNVVMANAPRGLALTDAHGTHVLDLAVGTDPDRADAASRALRDVPILAVSLPSDRILSPSGVFLEVCLDLALGWVQQRLGELFPGPEMDWPQVAVNLSYGLSAGSKEGSDKVPKRLAAFLGSHPKVKLFMPAGNDGKGKGRASLTTSAVETGIGWQVAADNPFSTYAEIWFQPGVMDDLTMTLVPPEGPGMVIYPNAALTAQEIVATGSDDPVARAYAVGLGAGGRRGLVLCVGPTASRRSNWISAPRGLWQVRIGPTASPVRVSVEAQSERSLRPSETGVRPSQLVSDHGVDPDPRGTLNALAVGSGAVIVAGYRLSDKQPVDWASRGDLTQNPGFAPNVAFPADRSVTRIGLIAAGYRSGSSITVQGTSFATALATRHFLRHILKGGTAADWMTLIAPPPGTPTDMIERGHPFEVPFNLNGGLIEG